MEQVKRVYDRFGNKIVVGDKVLYHGVAYHGIHGIIEAKVEKFCHGTVKLSFEVVFRGRLSKYTTYLCYSNINRRLLLNTQTDKKSTYTGNIDVIDRTWNDGE